MISDETDQLNPLGRLLVIDDDPTLLAAMLRLLGESGFQVEGADCAARGLELARRHPPVDLILLDLILPDMDGMELCKLLRAEPHLMYTAIILTSNYRNSPADQAEGFAIGVTEFIPRPVDNQEFLARIQIRMEEKRKADRWRVNHSSLLKQMTGLNTTVQQTNLANKELTEQLTAIFSHAPVCLMLTDEQGVVLRANPMFESIFGNSVEQVIGVTCGQAFSCINFIPSFRSEACLHCTFRKAIESTHLTGQGWSKYPISLCSRGNGKNVERQLHITTSKIKVGGEWRILVCLDDVTEKEQMAAALDLERLRFQHLLENLPFGIFVINANQEIEYANQRITDEFGPSVGQRCHEYFHGLDGSCPWCMNEELRKGEKHIWEKQVGANSRLYQIIDIPLPQSDGSFFKLVVFRDITEEKRANDALKTSQQKNLFLSDLLQSSSQPFAASTNTGLLIVVNSAYCALTGYSEQELQRMSFFDFTPEKWHQSDQMIREQLRCGKAAQTYEKEYIHRDGYTVPVEVLAHFRPGKEGEPDLFYGFVTDLRERMRLQNEAELLQKQLFQVQKMESIGSLAGGVAHDFNNMLSVILGFGDMALTKTAPGSALYDDISEMIEAAHRSAAITRQLLAFARRNTVSPTNLDLNQTIEGMLKMLKRLIGEHVRIDWHPAPSLEQIFVDPSQIDQILANLCVNARDAMSPNGTGTIRISTGMFPLSTAQMDDRRECNDLMVRLEVSDNGEGMSPEVCDRIFEPFYTTKAPGQGTGLGLATVYGIMKQLGGTIEVSSSLGKGSSFLLFFPPSKQPSDTELGVQEDILSHGTEHILIVEDEAAMLRLAGRILDSAGYRVTLAAKIDEAFAAIKEHHVDMVLTDVIMPEMNGKELVKQLKELQPGLCHLFMSGYTANVLDMQGVIADSKEFIRKPFTTKDLLMKIRQVLDREA